jgi:uncharacterized delta-60 repeat protein
LSSGVISFHGKVRFTVCNYARSSKGRLAASGNVRSQDILKKAFASVIEPLEGRRLLTGEMVGTAVQTDFYHNDNGGILVQLSGGKLLQVGNTILDNPGPDASHAFILARFNDNGSPDNTFDPDDEDGDGQHKLLVELPNPDDFTLVEVTGAAVDSAGRIVVVGNVNNNILGQSGQDWMVAVFTPAGAYDPTFGIDTITTDGTGVVVSDFTAGTSMLENVGNVARAVAIDADDKIVVGGIDTNDGNYFAVARYNTDGSLDTSSFGEGDGFSSFSTVAEGGSFEDLHALTIQPDGKILLGGLSFENQAAENAIATFAIQRFLSDGTLDTDFGNNPTTGTARTLFPSNAALFALEIDLSGPATILAGGVSDYLGASPVFALARYDMDGNLIGGVSTYLPAADLGGVITDLEVQSDGLILAGGSVDRAFLVPCGEFECEVAITALAIARFAANLSIDADFGTDGVAYSQFTEGTSDEHPATIAIQAASNNVVLSGTTRNRDFMTSQIRSGGVVTATTEIPHGYSGSTFVVIQDSQPASFNSDGLVGVTVVDATTFTYENVGVDESATVPGWHRTNIDFDLTRYSLTGGANASPLVEDIVGPATGVRSFEQTFSSSFSDDAGDSHTVTWDFGDASTPESGPAEPGVVTASHAYAASGVYTVTLTVSDGVNPPVEETFNITITNSSFAGGVLQIGGSGGNNVITVKSTNGGTQVVSDGNTTNFSNVTQIIIMGGDGNDDIKVNPGVTQTVMAFGGAGHDSIKGGSGTDILIGGDGDDLLHGQDGRDILIGGDGADRLVGQSQDDILVAGMSDHDSDPDALLTIQSEWTSGGTYAQRSANILNRPVGTATPGVGLNGSLYLTPDGEDATVFDDGDADLLTGNAGQDLFLFNADGPVADEITDLSNSEFAADLEWLMTE